ncbi:MAG: hypothetical protein V4538_15270 [Bacteroidota bacterium]
MIKLEKISTFGLRNLVEIAYKGDSELLDKYWGEDFNLEDAVNETMWMVGEVSKEAEMSYYSVELDDCEIGYVCCFEHNLYSFGININYRTKDNLVEFWERIKEIMGQSFICMLFPQNERAINFLKTQGMKIVDGVEQNCVTLLNI